MDKIRKLRGLPNKSTDAWKTPDLPLGFRIRSRVVSFCSVGLMIGVVIIAFVYFSVVKVVAEYTNCGYCPGPDDIPVRFAGER